MISDIIDSLLINNDFTTALFKTLTFARRIGNSDLADWVSRELNGYGKVTLPSYRYCKTSVLAVMGHGDNNITPESPLPMSCFSKEWQAMIMKKPFNESIASLEVLTKSDGQYIGKEFAADMCKFLTAEANKKGCRFSIISCRQLVTISEITGLITAAKTQLLELLLQIEQEYPLANPLIATPDEKRIINETINNHISHIYNINTSGDGGIINTGSDNDILTNNNVKND